MNDANKSMKNKICIVTGATSGIGKETAKALANKGAFVIVVGRNVNRCISTVKSIKRATNSTRIDYVCSDLSDLNQVRSLADTLKKKT